jgi:hypothetical protein
MRLKYESLYFEMAEVCAFYSSKAKSIRSKINIIEKEIKV